MISSANLEKTRFAIHDFAAESISFGQHHVWFCDLDEISELDKNAHFMSANEQARVARLKNDLECKRLMRRFIFIRVTIGQLVGVTPEALKFCYTECGKPYLTHHDKNKKLCFNVSHTENILALAVVFDCDVGIDIEIVNQNIDFFSVAKNQFTTKSLTLLDRLPIPQAIMTFYRLWTRNEALLKLDGCGFAKDIDGVLDFQSLCSYEFKIGKKQLVGALAIGFTK
jgi:4'-phosphopantetheinyl transferase